MKAHQIRQAFLDYFAAKKHTIVKSASLIPQNDPTLYFTNAGMVPFKNMFTGRETKAYTRAASSQKCMRVSGKHNDLEHIGRTARHHTFFEMLGNFSFGDYFKQEAIAYAWDFLTQVAGLPKEKLWITVYRDDDEAFHIWHKKTGIPAERIKRMGKKSNFWSMGDTGPCGPCSEIHFEQDFPCPLNNPKCAMGECDCDKYMEVWNLVFMQFEQFADGTTKPLPKPSIDTGMGLERLAALLQNKTSNYDTDLFMPVIHAAEELVKKKYGANAGHDISLKVLSDHIRACVFLMSDGIMPSNDGRGYVLRRILRRAIRHGRMLGQTRPFFHKLVPVVVDEMSPAYPEIKTSQSTVEKIIFAEEERFLETLDNGLGLLEDETTMLKKNRSHVLTGETAFKLYDTYGFPLDLTELILSDHGIKVDHAAFEACMKSQKERARAGWKGTGAQHVQSLYLSLGKKHQTRFLGYEMLQSPAKVVALIRNGKLTDTVSEGEFEAVFDQTPFYGESGGQVGDKGKISAKDFQAAVYDTQKPSPHLHVHKAKVTSGVIKKDSVVQLDVFRDARKPTMLNHTATHILHAALRKILGKHVRQAGSLVNDKLLRFDFTHFEAIPPETLEKIEDEVNSVILDDIPVTKQVMDYDAAIKHGALAFFGEKYEEMVRVISVGDYSVELCGGTHLNHSGEIGYFKLASESSIAAGVRRIEAVTGMAAAKFAQKQSQILQSVANSLKVNAVELPETVQKLQEKIKMLDKDLQKLKQQILHGASADYLKNAVTIHGVKTLVYETDDANSIRDVATAIHGKLGSGIAVVTAQTQDKAIVVVTVTKDLVKKFPAQKLLVPLAELIGGRGGGKPDMAQAGGNNPDGLKKIKNKLKELIETWS